MHYGVTVGALVPFLEAIVVQGWVDKLVIGEERVAALEFATEFQVLIEI